MPFLHVLHSTIYLDSTKGELLWIEGSNNTNSSSPAILLQISGMSKGGETALDRQQQVKSDQEAPLALPKNVCDSSSDGSAEHIAPSGGFKNTVAK